MVSEKIQDNLSRVIEQTPGESNYHQAMQELFDDIKTFVDDSYDPAIIHRMCFADRVLQFTVTWYDDAGEMQVNQGYRVQFNHAIGPYKGGLRFHPEVTLDDFKFLGFEQTFKDALTGIPMGGAKGGADFDPSGRSNAEIKRFCEAFMTELSRYIGPDQDVPAGDIGVGARELGYLFAHYKAMTGQFRGAVTGKGPSFGGSCIRTEATGFGCVYFLRAVLDEQGQGLKKKRCALSGAGNVALYAAKKLIENEAVVLTLSDSKGVLFAENGFSDEQIDTLIVLKEQKHGALADYTDVIEQTDGLRYETDASVWSGEYDIAIPCATQNEVGADEAKQIIDAGASIVCQAANMPCTDEAVQAFTEAKLLNLPSKAVNAGGVAVSGLERTQNAMGMSWSRERVDNELENIMLTIHRLCVEEGETDSGIDYAKGANLAAFEKVFQAMSSYLH
ncbi:MAG: NADP-specific glutamate dehydrogenase [Pseudomonadota bacterium]|nr:NADP-specific glutamate dehydrogenase [Pseudomonadota bacterium]